MLLPHGNCRSCLRLLPNCELRTETHLPSHEIHLRPQESADASTTSDQATAALVSESERGRERERERETRIPSRTVTVLELRW